MIIRLLTQDDMTEHAKVSSSAFIWPVDWDKARAEKPKANILGAFCDDNKTLMADLEVYDFQNSFCGKYLGSNGIGGVASRPEYRRKGAVRELFKTVFSLAPEKGWSLSMLYPFSNNYYRLFGYETITRKVSISLDFSRLSHIERCFDVKLYSAEVFDELMRVYQNYSKRFNLMFKRKSDENMYTKAFEKNEYTYLWYDGAGNCGSYVSYKVDRPTSTVNVREIIYSTRESLLGILGFLRSYDGNIKTLHFEALPETTDIPEIIGEYNALDTSVSPGIAGRILNLKTVLESNAYPDSRGRFSLLSHDSLPENSGIFEVEYEKGNALVTRREKGDYDIALTAPAASKILLSGEGFDAQRAGFLRGVELKTGAEDFFAAFPRREVDVHDGF